MGREVRMVPKDWQHPKREGGGFIALFDGDFETCAADWDKECMDCEDNSGNGGLSASCAGYTAKTPGVDGRFYLADCMEGMGGFADNYFDLAIVDPPYGVGNFSQPKHNARPYNKAWNIEWNDTPPDEQYFKELFRVSKHQIIWGANYYRLFISANGTIVWDKGNNSGIGSACEIASASMFERVVKYEYQWTGFCVQGKYDEKIHPCQKPVALYQRLLIEHAREGWKILDTHVGSGSSLIACEREGFDYVGYEIDKDYYEAACKRIERETAQMSLL